MTQLECLVKALVLARCRYQRQIAYPQTCCALRAAIAERRRPWGDYTMRESGTRAVNAADVDDASRRAAQVGLTVTDSKPVLLPVGTVLCRTGHEKVKGKDHPVAANFASPWWSTEADYSKVFQRNEQDPTWAARLVFAISSEWKGDCHLQCRVRLAQPLLAWRGFGRAISGGPKSELAEWCPDPSVRQLYIPGLGSRPLARRAPLFITAFASREHFPLLFAGNQVNLNTGIRYKPRPTFDKLAEIAARGSATGS